MYSLVDAAAWLVAFPTSSLKQTDGYCGLAQSSPDRLDIHSQQWILQPSWGDPPITPLGLTLALALMPTMREAEALQKNSQNSPTNFFLDIICVDGCCGQPDMADPQSWQSLAGTIA